MYVFLNCDEGILMNVLKQHRSVVRHQNNFYKHLSQKDLLRDCWSPAQHSLRQQRSSIYGRIYSHCDVNASCLVVAGERAHRSHVSDGKRCQDDAREGEKGEEEIAAEQRTGQVCSSERVLGRQPELYRREQRGALC